MSYRRQMSANKKPYCDCDRFERASNERALVFYYRRENLTEVREGRTMLRAETGSSHLAKSRRVGGGRAAAGSSKVSSLLPCSRDSPSVCFRAGAFRLIPESALRATIVLGMKL